MNETINPQSPEVKRISDLVYKTCGIVFKDSNLTVLISRIITKLKEKNMKLSDYADLIERDKNELSSFIDFVTTNYTSFFRNTRHFEILAEIVLPEVVKRNSQNNIKTIKIWSAACSSGEEPYTIAMVVNEYLENNGLYKTGWSYSIIGSDISLESLFLAKEGKYPYRSVEKIEKKYLDKYFTKVDNDYMIKDFIKKNIRFDYHNLIYDNGIRDMDIAFCRNVLIYFDEEVQRKVITNIYEGTKKNAFLFIGHSETLIGVFDGFKPMNTPKGVIYVKQ